MLEGKILITGGAGYLGRSILRRIERENWPAQVTVYSRDEHKQAEIKKRWPQVRLVLGDIQNLERLTAAAAGHDLIIHAGALKFIPEAEFNVLECIDVNVIGSRNVALAAMRAGVATVVALSTDKAAAPLNTYGATKMLMERTFSELNAFAMRSRSDTRFVSVRYGNVVSSSGSVIPVFRDQLSRLGHMEITSNSMSRFWISMDEAIDLIAVAATFADTSPGAIFVRRCGAMMIWQLAQIVGDAWLSRVGSSYTIKEVGLRPGEKLHETLILPSESVRAVQVTPLIAAIMPPTYPALDETPAEYRSDDPDFWISKDEMQAMIEDAATI